MAQECTTLASKCALLLLVTAYQVLSTSACHPQYEYFITEFCLTKFSLDMKALDQRLWCSWDDTVELYGSLTNCTFQIATKMGCFWPNQKVDEFFINIHRDYFKDCALTGRLPHDPPNHILGPFIAVPVLITLLMTALVVWRSKRSQGVM
ncbi:receptor activity-modifying protein 1 [Alosa pseudoharengus]|uniref:receptor activity-modifying protein 1 n=1 Tax=Alosa pseudoharengus TaxID=34774 RepID=UPI003F8BD2CA